MTNASAMPQIIQGGMGVGVSNWRLARAVAMAGHLGVISGTGIDTVFVRRLQDGDIGGHLRRAMARFPMPQVAQEALRKYFRPEGRAPGEPYKELPMYRQGAKVEKEHFTMLATFVEVLPGQGGPRPPHRHEPAHQDPAAQPGDALRRDARGVDHVLMGAGIPRDIPGILDELSQHRRRRCGSTSRPYRATMSRIVAHFDPAELRGDGLPELERPAFFPIISTHSLASMLRAKATGAIHGFIVEGPTAGGHNAPPRGGKTQRAR